MADTHARKDYDRGELRESDLDPDPIRQFGAWFEAAVRSEVPEPEAMTLATATTAGLPSARIVLLRGYDDRGFTFFTNYEGRKGRELQANPHAALVFYWHDLECQVRVEGLASRVSTEESDAYFATRPLGSRRAAWASPQSEVVGRREDLEGRFARVETEFGAAGPPRPEHWGGFRVAPVVVEFWQGRRSRLHDRFRYSRGVGGGWEIARLAP